MKCVSLFQPWASLVAAGLKRIETRSWATRHRGPLAIHASATWSQGLVRLCRQAPFPEALAALGTPLCSCRVGRMPHLHGAPLGAVVAVCRLADVVRVEAVRGTIGDRERSFGDYASGRWAWILEDVRRLPKPQPARGGLGLWQWQLTPDEAEQLMTSWVADAVARGVDVVGWGAGPAEGIG